CESSDGEARIAVLRHVVALLPVRAHTAGVRQDTARLSRHVRAEVPARRVRDQGGAGGLLMVGDPGVLALLRRLDRRPALLADMPDDVADPLGLLLEAGGH